MSLKPYFVEKLSVLAPPSSRRHLDVHPLVPDQRRMPRPQQPVVMLFTVNQHETTAVLSRFDWYDHRGTETRGGITYNALGIHGGMRVIHRVSGQGEFLSQLAAEDAFRSWSPQAMIGVGVAFGVDADEQTIGDVLVSERIRDYESARVGKSPVPRGGAPEASYRLVNQFRLLDHNRCDDPELGVNWPKLRFGTILTGNKLVDNEGFRDQLLELEPEAVGGEMEAWGLHAVCHRHKVDWIIVKGICDWADGSKSNPHKNRDQRKAAEKASLVVHASLAMGHLYQ